MKIIDSLKRFRAHGIKASDFVVEIGSGNNPYWRSDLLLDKFVVDSTERPAGRAPLVLDRPFVVADALQLPFGDKKVDFLIARNILEHIVPAEQFLNEMARVSKRGYITVPSSLSEKLFGWAKHVWFISTDGNTLHLRAKQRTLYDPELSELFHGLHRQNVSFRKFYQENRHLFIVEHYWESSINFCIEAGQDDFGSVKTARAEFDLESTIEALRQSPSRTLRQTLHSRVRRLISSSGVNSIDDIVDRFACPLCSANVAFHEANLLICKSCGVKYPVINGVPIFVSEIAESRDIARSI